MRLLLLASLLRQARTWCTAEGCQNEYEKPLADYTKYPEGDTYASACYSAADKNTTALISCLMVAVASSADARPCDKARVVIDDDCNPMLPPSALMTGMNPTSSGYLNNSPL